MVQDSGEDVRARSRRANVRVQRPCSFTPLRPVALCGSGPLRAEPSVPPTHPSWIGLVLRDASMGWKVLLQSGMRPCDRRGAESPTLERFFPLVAPGGRPPQLSTLYGIAA